MTRLFLPWQRLSGMIVIYDATGVRRQAGIHAERINEIMRDFIESRQFPDKDLKEMLGHTPFEVIAGVVLGVLISLTIVRFHAAGLFRIKRVYRVPAGPVFSSPGS